MLDLPPQAIDCIAQAIYSEARGESEKGQRAVGHVILNRTKHKHFPDKPCAVVKQPGQFTYRPGHGVGWLRIVQLSKHLGSDPTGGALYFKTTSSRTSWPFRLLTRIGNHLFYR